MASNLTYADFEKDDFFGIYKYYQEFIDDSLHSALEGSDIEEPMLSAIRHAVFPAGKRIRPMLSMLFALDLGFDPKALVSQAVALELLHCSSLVHDDLPALDNDDERRGRPSCHKAFGEAAAILAGDAMIALALECAGKGELRPELLLRSVRLLSKSFKDVCRGQLLDMEKVSDLDKVQGLKTGALFQAALLLPCIAIDLHMFPLKSVEKFSSEYGRFFQLADDIIDVWGSSKARGRQESSDRRNEKVTRVHKLTKAEAKGVLNSNFNMLDKSLQKLEEHVQEYRKEAKPKFQNVKQLLFMVYERASNL